MAPRVQPSFDHRMTWKFGRYASFDHCRVLLPWFKFAHGLDPFSQVRRLALALELKCMDHRPASRVVAFLVYLPINLRQIGIAVRRHGKNARQVHQLGYLKQLAGLLYFSWRLNHPPHDYYLQKIWLQTDRKKWSGYLTQREHVLLVTQLEQSLPLREFDDKLELFFRLRAGAIPTIPILRAVSNGRWLPEFATPPADIAWQQSLVTKPTDGNRYDGVRVWHFNPHSESYTCELFEKKDGREVWVADEILDLTALLDWVRRASTERTYLIQPLMETDPALASISPHNVANFRLVTIPSGGSFRLIAAVLRMGYDNRKFVPGTYLAEIDLETGILGPATGREEQWSHGKIHLETGAQIAGRRIENWAELKALAIRGHDQFHWMPSIGWDIISSNQGAMVMEANAFWGVDIVQGSGRFLGDAGYAEAYLETYDRGN